MRNVSQSQTSDEISALDHLKMAKKLDIIASRLSNQRKSSKMAFVNSSMIKDGYSNNLSKVNKSHDKSASSMSSYSTMGSQSQRRGKWKRSKRRC